MPGDWNMSMHALDARGRLSMIGEDVDEMRQFEETKSKHTHTYSGWQLTVTQDNNNGR